MTLAEKIRHDAANEVKVYLEDRCWVAYEQSAFWFYLQKQYRAVKWFEESLGQEVVSIRFPVGCFVKGTGYTRFVYDSYQIVLLAKDIDIEEYIRWKNSIRLNKEKEIINNNN